MRYKEIKPEQLYVYRKLLNAEEIIDWLKETGMFLECLTADDFHITVISSQNKVNWEKFSADTNDITVPYHSSRRIVPLGKQALVFSFDSKELEDIQKDYVELGAKSKFPKYIPHIAFSYNAGIYSEEYVTECTKTLVGKKMFQGDFKFGKEIFDNVNRQKEFKEQKLVLRD